METLTDSEYAKIHVWLRKECGNATRCSDKNCLKTSNRFQWALKKGKTHARLPKNYVQLCVICHKRYDTRWQNYHPKVHDTSIPIRISLKDYETLRKLAYKAHKPMTKILEEIIKQHETRNSV